MSALVNKSAIQMDMSDSNKANNIRMFDRSIESKTNSSIEYDDYLRDGGAIK